MSSTSLLPALEDHARNEYSFPIVDAVEPTSSPSDSNPSGSLPRSPPSHSHSHSRSLHRSSTNTGSSSRHRRSDRDRHGDRDRHRDRDRDKDPSARVLSRIASREFRDIKNTRTLLVLTTERLENETRRADRAEQHALSLVQKLREANESTLFARSEVSSLNSSLGLYKLQLEHAQREIERAQGIVNQLEKERIEAESEAARARTTARKLREERLLELAREEGRKEGYREGYSRGKNMGYFEAKTSERRGVNGRASLASMSANSNTNTGTVSDERRREGGRDSWSTRRDSESQNQTYGVAPPPVLSPLLSYTDGERSADQVSIEPPPPVLQEPEPVPEPEPEPPDTEPTLPNPYPPPPIPDLRPRRSHTPGAIPIPDPTSLLLHHPEPISEPHPEVRIQNRHRSPPIDDIVRPIPYKNGLPSQSHPATPIPPDNWIPYADGASGGMNIPPPHEFSRPVSPSMTPSPPPVAQLPAPVAMPVPHRVREDDDTDSDPNIHVISSTPPNEYLPDEHEGGGYGYPSSRDYAYSYPHPYEERNFSGSGSGSGGSGRSSGGGRGGGGGGPNVVIPIAHNASIGTPQSRSSTRISQYDIVGPPRAGGGSRMRGDSRSATVPVPPPPPALNPGPRMSSREFGPGSRMTPPAERQRQSPVPPLPVIPPSSSQYQQHQGRMTETPASSLTKVERSSTPQRTPRNDRFIPSPHYKYDKPSGSSTSSSTTTTEQTKSKKVKKADNRSTLEKLFKKRFKERTSPPTSSAAAGERDGDGARPVPDIVVESPSTRSESDVWSEKLDAPPNNLLSPDHANIPLAGMDVPDPIVVMPYNAPTIPPSGMDFSQHQVPYQSYSYQNQNPSQGNSRSQTPGYSNQSKNPIPAGPGMGELPFGFVPTSYGPPVIPSPSLRTGGGGSHTLPPSHISSQHHPPPQLPGTVGSGSGGGSGPSSPYAVAPIPANVVYPNPPARSPIPTSRSPRPVSPQRTSPIPRDVVNLRMSNLSGSTSTSGTGENVGGGRRDKLSPLSLGKPFHGFATSDG